MAISAPAYEAALLDDHFETIKVQADDGNFVLVNSYKKDYLNHKAKVIILSPAEAHALLSFLASHLFPAES